MTVSDAARRLLAEKGYDPKMGARPMARVIQDEIKQVLANFNRTSDLMCCGQGHR